MKENTEFIILKFFTGFEVFFTRLVRRLCVEPVYAELPGWKTDMTKMQSEDEFPEEFNAYLTFLEEQLGVEIKIVSVGPDRAQTIERYTEE